MNLEMFTQLLAENEEKPFLWQLPNESWVPQSFHVTEVGRVHKQFIDCGGRVHEQETCQLQVWLGGDEDHRLFAGKMRSILEKARPILPRGSAEVEVEYEEERISQYKIGSYTISADAVIFQLEAKHTDCLAKESCLPAIPLSMQSLEACCAGSCNC